MTDDAQAPIAPVTEDKPSGVLVVLLIIPLMGILLALTMIAFTPRPTPDALLDGMMPAPSLINFTAPPFDVLDLNGEVFSLLDYRGRIVFLNFWQTTCIPCGVEIPHLAQFSREQGEDGVAVIAINFGETNETVRTWLAERDIVGLTVGMDYESRIQRAYGVMSTPTTFVIDENGTVIHMKLGTMSLDEMYQYADSVRAAARPS